MGEAAAQAERSELLKKLAAATASQGITPATATCYTILKNLDAELVRRYILKLEEAKVFLKSYVEEIDNLNRRLEKVDSTARAMLGGEALAGKRAAVEETLDKLAAHQHATIRRLLNG